MLNNINGVSSVCYFLIMLYVSIFYEKYAAQYYCSADVSWFYVNIYYSFALIHIISYRLRVYICKSMQVNSESFPPRCKRMEGTHDR